MNVTVFPDPESLAEGAARRISELIRESAGGSVSLALAGGSTPAATYQRLREADVPWNRVYAWIGDERFVPPTHADNNGAMVQRSLLAGLDATFFPVPWSDEASPADAAAAYERTLLGFLDHDDDGPRPDVMILGMGDDGHTLSLFPDTDALNVTDRWFVENWVENKSAWRLTATYPLAHRSRHAIVLVAGAGKAEALARVLEPPPDSEPLPARRIMDGTARVVWLVDEAAASNLVSTDVIPGLI